MIARLIGERVQHLFGSLGYVVIPKWRLSEPKAQQLFDSLGYALVPKSQLAGNAVQLFADSVGYFLVPKSSAWRLPGAVHLKRLFELLKTDCVLDVGANVGQWRNFLRDEVGYEGLIVSFEPIPNHVRTLSERAKSDRNWVIEGCALGNSSGEARFNVMSETQFSSFLSPDHSSVRLFEAQNRVKEEITVRVKTLDEAFADLEKRFSCNSPYLKLDTQGFDLEVLKGASNTLSKVQALQTEASVKPIYTGMPDYTTTLAELDKLGFELSGIFPNNSGHFPRLIEFDAVMVKKTMRQA